LASPVSGWVRENTSAANLADDMATAIAESLSPPGQVATLIVPHDCQLAKAESVAKPKTVKSPSPVDSTAIESAASALLKSKSAALFLGGKALREDAIMQAGRIVAKTGCRLISETMISRMDRHPDMPMVQRLPYFPQSAIKTLSDIQTLIFIGAKKPVSFWHLPPPIS
jgi:acetolactate synthase-1/2/3 large subunit